MQAMSKVLSTHSPVNTTHEQAEVGLMSLSPGLFHHHLTFQSRKVLTLSQASEGFRNNLHFGYLLCLETKKRHIPKADHKSQSTTCFDLSLRSPHPVQDRNGCGTIPTEVTSGWTKFSQLLYPKKLMSEARSWCRENHVVFKNASYSRDANLRSSLFFSLVMSRQQSTSTAFALSFFCLVDVSVGPLTPQSKLRRKIKLCLTSDSEDTYFMLETNAELCIRESSHHCFTLPSGCHSRYGKARAWRRPELYFWSRIHLYHTGLAWVWRSFSPQVENTAER